MNESHAEGTRDADVAVIIVTYKSARLTIDSLRSIQTEREASVIHIRAVVVDNDSGDIATISEAAEVNGWGSWVTLLAAPRNGGFAYGNNLGVLRACADRVPSYLYLLNPDAQVRRGAITSLVRFLQTHNDVGIAGGSFENPDGSDWPFAFRFPTILSELDNGLQLGILTRLLRRWVVARQMTRIPQPVDWISGAAMMIRSTAFLAIGGMDETYFLYFEETDFCRRAKLAGFSTWYVPESRVMHIAGQSTKVRPPGTPPDRLPAYWFESRHRYFTLTFGVGGAAVIDIVTAFAHSFGLLKRVVTGRKRHGVPHFIRDLLKYSAFRPRNRIPPAIQSALLQKSDESVQL